LGHGHSPEEIIAGSPSTEASPCLAVLCAAIVVNPDGPSNIEELRVMKTVTECNPSIALIRVKMSVQSGEFFDSRHLVPPDIEHLHNKRASIHGSMIPQIETHF